MEASTLSAWKSIGATAGETGEGVEVGNAMAYRDRDKSEEEADGC